MADYTGTVRVDGQVVAVGGPDQALCEDVLAARFGQAVTVLRAPSGEIVVAPQRDGRG